MRGSGSRLVICSASATAAVFEARKSVEYSSWPSWSIIAWWISRIPWPRLTFHSEEVASRYSRPFTSYTWKPRPSLIRRISWALYCFIWVKGCQRPFSESLSFLAIAVLLLTRRPK